MVSGGYYEPPRGGFKPRPPAKPVTQREAGGVRVGQLVEHARFGQGVIVAAEGGGSDARVQVNFGAGGIKWLLLSVAKLEVR